MDISDASETSAEPGSIATNWNLNELELALQRQGACSQELSHITCPGQEQCRTELALCRNVPWCLTQTERRQQALTHRMRFQVDPGSTTVHAIDDPGDPVTFGISCPSVKWGTLLCR
jgi:hypothetical protein